jgi:hypothetical protein
MGRLVWLHPLVPHGLSDAYGVPRPALPSRRGVLGPSGRVAGVTKRMADAKNLDQFIQANGGRLRHHSFVEAILWRQAAAAAAASTSTAPARRDDATASAFSASESSS